MYISLAIHDFQFSVLTTQHEKYYSGGNSSPCSLAGFLLLFFLPYYGCLFVLSFGLVFLLINR